MSDPLAWLVDLEGVGSAFAATRDGIDGRLRDRGLRRTTPAQTAESLLLGAHASALLEGSPATLAEVREGTTEPVAEASLRLSTQVLSAVPTLGRAPLQALARLHALADGTPSAGRPVSAEAAERMSGLASVIASTKVPALLLAAVAHAEVATVAPFASYNGLVARALERLILVARGVDPASLVVVEGGHAADPAIYRSNLRGYASGEVAGVQAWLLYAAQAQTRGAELAPLSAP